MSGLVDGSPLHGVCLVALDPHEDDRGRFTEVFARHWATGIEPVQWSVVESAAGALRGMHLHRRHTEYLSVVAGHLSIGLQAMPRSGSDQWHPLLSSSAYST